MIVELGPGDRARWEAFVTGREDALPYHHPAWTSVLEDAYGYRLAALGHVTPDGRLDGVLPLVRRRGVVTGRRLVSLPHTPVAGPVASDAGVRAALVGAAVERARADGVTLELKTAAHALDDLAPDVAGVPWSTTYVLSLPASPDELRFGPSRNHGRIRWAVRKAARLGVAVRPAESEQELAAWHRIYLETMRVHAAPPRPLRYFSAMWRHLRPGGLMRLLLAEHEGRLVGGSLLLQHGATVLYAYNGRVAADLALRPNDVLQWRAIHDAVADGFARYDFGEVEDHQDGLADFKTKWGARPEPLFRYFHPPGARPAAGSTSPAVPRRAAEAVWRRLPVPVTARVGDLLLRRL